MNTVIISLMQLCAPHERVVVQYDLLKVGILDPNASMGNMGAWLIKLIATKLGN